MFTFINHCRPMWLVLCLLLSSMQAAMAENANVLATRLSTLRGEVESLSQALGEKQADYRSQLQGYARQDADLSLEARRGTTTLAKLSLALETKSKANESKAQAAQVLDPVFDSGVTTLSAYIGSGLPFKRKARLKSLTELRAQRVAKAISSVQAMNRLWALTEDELRMQRESIVHRQEIAVDGQSVLADVLRVGMVMMFFRIKNRGVGYAIKSEQGWGFETAEDPKTIQQIEKAFEQFSKQVRVGTFTLPNRIENTGGAQ